MAEAATAPRAQTSPARDPLLSVRNLEAWYGESHVLHGVSFDVYPGEVVTLLGRNGAGKTTTLKSVMGILPKRKGSVVFQGKELMHVPARYVAREGIAFCPEERGIFSSLSVEENLMLPPQVKPGGMTVEQIFELFPNLKERLSSQGTKLSGGEQQMLTTARSILGQPSVLLLDEPLEGLAPVICDELMAAFSALAATGAMTILMIEQRIQAALNFAQDVFILERGEIAWSGTPAQLEGEPETVERLLGVAH